MTTTTTTSGRLSHRIARDREAADQSARETATSITDRVAAESERLRTAEEVRRVSIWQWARCSAAKIEHSFGQKFH